MKTLEELQEVLDSQFEASNVEDFACELRSFQADIEFDYLGFVAGCMILMKRINHTGGPEDWSTIQHALNEASGIYRVQPHGQVRTYTSITLLASILEDHVKVKGDPRCRYMKATQDTLKMSAFACEGTLGEARNSKAERAAIDAACQQYRAAITDGLCDAGRFDKRKHSMKRNITQKSIDGAPESVKACGIPIHSVRRIGAAAAIGDLVERDRLLKEVRTIVKQNPDTFQHW